jgi:hypothetical protein
MSREVGRNLRDKRRVYQNIREELLVGGIAMFELVVEILATIGCVGILLGGTVLLFALAYILLKEFR